MSQIKKLYPELRDILEWPSKKLYFEDSWAEEEEPTNAHEVLYPECAFSIPFR